MPKYYLPDRWTVAVIAFACGLWLGYVSAVRVARNCLHPDPGEYVALVCPDWLSGR